MDSDDYDSFLVNTGAKKHPIFEITVRRKFEVVELCEIFFNKWAKYLYLIILIIYSLLAAWSLATVAGSSWALNIPYNFSGVEMCEGDPFHHRVLPVGEPCRNAYYFSLFLYAIIVVVLSLLDLKEQAIIQMILGLMRFLTVGAIVVYSLAKVAEGGDVCERPEDAVGSGTVGSGNVPWTLLENGTRYENCSCLLSVACTFPSHWGSSPEWFLENLKSKLSRVDNKPEEKRVSNHRSS